jgi:hypothetical protein
VNGLQRLKQGFVLVAFCCLFFVNFGPEINELLTAWPIQDDFFVNSIDSESAAGTMVRPPQEYLLLLILILGWR